MKRKTCRGCIHLSNSGDSYADQKPPFCTLLPPVPLNHVVYPPWYKFWKKPTLVTRSIWSQCNERSTRCSMYDAGIPITK